MMPDPVPHTIAAAFAWTRAALSGAEAEAEAVELFDRLLDLRRATLMAFPERILDASARARLLQAVQRRRAGEPLAYVLGWRGFWTLDLQVGPEVLIPRADTERLVELALQRMPPGVDMDVADLGTGSGAIALALACERPRARLLACDASASALSLARANARRLGALNVTFVRGDWARALLPQSLHLLLSNPPYIEAADPHLHEGDLRFEPIGALASGPDGLDDLRRIVADAPRLLRPGGWILLEHGRAQGGAVRGLLQAAGFADVATEQDVEGRDRVSLGRMA